MVASKSKPRSVPRKGESVRRPVTSAQRPPSPHWQLNWPLFLGTLVAGVALAVPAYFWHAYQIKRNAAIFLTRAESLAEEKQWDNALLMVQRYLQVYPEDTQARIRLAQVFDHIADASPAKIPASERLYAVAVGLASDQPELRVRHAERLLEMRRFGDALAEVNAALQIDKTDATALRLKAAAAYGDARARGDFADADALVANFRAAIAATASSVEQIDLAIQLAEMYRRDLKHPSALERQSLADQVVDEMVLANADRSVAWVARYLYRARTEGAGRDSDLDRALELDVAHTDILAQMSAAVRAREHEDMPQAIERYQYVIAARKGDIRGYQGLVQLQAEQRNFPDAITTLKDGIAAVRNKPDQLALELSLASVYLGAGQIENAGQILTVTGKRIESGLDRGNSSGANPLASTWYALRAQWYMEKQQPSQAVGLLKRCLQERATGNSAQEVAFRSQALMQLGRCYAAMKHWDQAATTYKEATTLQPQAVAPQLAAANAWQAAGRLDEAIREYRQAAQLPGATDEIWASLVGAQIRQQVTAPEKQRDWQTVDASLAEARKRFSNSKALESLAAQAKALRVGTRETMKLLEEAQSAAKSPQLTEQLILAYESEGESGKADETLRKFAESSPDQHDVVVLRSALCAARKEYDQAHQLLSEALPHVPADRQAGFRFRLVTVALRAGKLDEARKTLAELASGDARNEMLLEMLADMALETRDLADLANWEEELKSLEGPEGTGWRFYKAQRLLLEVTNVSDPRLLDVEQLTGEIERLRPMWPIGFVLQGQLADRRGQAERAIEAYRKAIDLGEHRSFVREQLVFLLFTIGQIDEVESYLAELGDNVVLSPRLANITISLKLRHGATGDAVQLARQEVERRPNDCMSYVVLGQTFLAAEQENEAEQAFRQATQVAPKDLRAWQALFGFLAGSGKRDSARELIGEIRASVALEERELLPILAQDYLLLRDEKGASALFQELLTIAADDVTALRRIAGFFLNRDPELSEKCLRQAIKKEPDMLRPQQDLVAFLITRGGDAQLAEAEGLLKSFLEGESKSDSTVQSLQARFLLRRGRAQDRDAARKILEDLATRGQAADDDRVALSRYYTDDGHPQKALEQAYVLVARKNPQPAHLASYIDLLLQDNRGPEASPWVEKLIAADPDSFATLSVRARLLAKQEKSAEVEPLVEEFLKRRLMQAQTDDEKSEVLLTVGKLYAFLQMDAQTERIFRDAAASTPQGYQTLAAWLASRGRTEEAVELCLSAAADDKSPQAATTLARCLVLGNGDQELARRAEPILSAAYKKHSDNVELLFVLATWKLVQGKDKDAVPLLRQVLSADPRHLMARNNLAASLSEQAATRQEAKDQIEQAIAQAGPMTELLDTKGMVLLFSGDADGAIKMFQEVTTRTKSDSRYLFHFALALQRGGKMSEARDALDRARKLNIDTAVLTPKQKLLLAELERGL